MIVKIARPYFKVSISKSIGLSTLLIRKVSVSSVLCVSLVWNRYILNVLPHLWCLSGSWNCIQRLANPTPRYQTSTIMGGICQGGISWDTWPWGGKCQRDHTRNSRQPSTCRPCHWPLSSPLQILQYHLMSFKPNFIGHFKRSHALVQVLLFQT